MHNSPGEGSSNNPTRLEGDLGMASRLPPELLFRDPPRHPPDPSNKDEPTSTKSVDSPLEEDDEAASSEGGGPEEEPDEGTAEAAASNNESKSSKEKEDMVKEEPVRERKTASYGSR